MEAHRSFRSRAAASTITILLHALLIAWVLKTSMGLGHDQGHNQAPGTSVDVSIFPISQKPAGKAAAPEGQPKAAGPRTPAVKVQRPIVDAPSDKAEAPSAPSTSTNDFVIGSPSDQASSAQDFRAQLLAYIAKFEIYPAQARIQHIQGRVALSFLMARDGSVSDLRISQSSGFPILDDAAVETVMRALPLPAIPPDLSAPLQIELPVDFSVRS